MNNRKKLVSLLAGIMAAIMLLSLILSIIPAVSAASSSEIRQQIEEMEKRQEELQEEMEELRGQYEETEDEIANMIGQKNILDQEIAILLTQIDVINQEISAYNLLIADKQDEYDAARNELEAMKEKYKARIRAMEEEGSLTYWAVLFEANSFSDLLDRLNMVEEIAAADERRLQEMREAAQVVAAAQEELAAGKRELEETQAQLLAKQEELTGKQLEMQDLIAELLAKCEEIEGLYEQLEAEDAELLDEIAQAEKEYDAAKLREYLAWLATSTTAPPPTTTAPTTQPTEPPSTQPGETTAPTQPTSEPTEPETTAPVSESWIIPCSYRYMSSPFGKRDQPTAGASTYHEGVDLAAAEGTPIVAARSGIVTGATYGSAAGYYVRINHGDGYSSIYMHMQRFIVSPGQYVNRGQVIGYVGKTGVATGNHLHFGIAYNGAYVNPALYISFY